MKTIEAIKKPDFYPLEKKKKKKKKQKQTYLIFKTLPNYKSSKF